MNVVGETGKTQRSCAYLSSAPVLPRYELVVDALDREVHEREVVGALCRLDVLLRDRVDVPLDVAREGLGVELALGLVLDLDHPLEVVERELGVDRDELLDADHGVDPLAALEPVLGLVGRGRQPVAEQVLEQELAEAPAGLGRAEDLLEAGEIVGAGEHLRRCALDTPELLGDVDGGLARALLRREQPAVEAREAPVDPRVDVAQPPVDALLDAAKLAREQATPAARRPDDARRRPRRRRRVR